MKFLKGIFVVFKLFSTEDYLVENKTLILLLSNDHVTEQKLKGDDTYWFQFRVPTLYFVLCNA